MSTKMVDLKDRETTKKHQTSARGAYEQSKSTSTRRVSELQGLVAPSSVPNRVDAAALQHTVGNRTTASIIHRNSNPGQSSATSDVQRWAYCTPPRLSAQDCPPREPGERKRAQSGPMSFRSIQDNASGEGGFLVVNFDIGSHAIKSSLLADTAWKQFVKELAADGSQWKLLGFSDCEGSEGANQKLRQDRAAAVMRILPRKVRSQIVSLEGAPKDDCITENWNAADRTFNRSVAFIRISRNVRMDSEVLEARKRRSIQPAEQDLLERLENLAYAAQTEASHSSSVREGMQADRFTTAALGFKRVLKQRLEALYEGQPLPRDLRFVVAALMLWSKDPGNQWGEGSWDSNDLVMSAKEYATVPASQYKCNAYVSEVAYRSFQVVHKVYASDQQKGQYFPFRAKDWGDPNRKIPHFAVVTSPKLGDVWSNGSHTGIYLGNYGGLPLYVSARDDGDGVWGLESEIQKAHGIQIKVLEPGGVYRRYTTAE
jgi:outer membrane protein OmpA-like peptidoglycan-associated protein